jgi:hypothetical protein
VTVEFNREFVGLEFGADMETLTELKIDRRAEKVGAKR